MAQDPSGDDSFESGLADTELAVDVAMANVIERTGDSSGARGAEEFALATGEPAVVPVQADEESPLADDPVRYEEGPVLGAGGMGEVRLYRDRRIGRHVAMKSLLTHTDTPSTRRRFLREARVQGQLEHPAVVPVYDLGVDAHGSPHFTMKRVRGETLARVIDMLARGDRDYAARYGRRRLLVAFTQVCHAVHFAHERGVVHRDLKPSNMMIGDYGEVYVLDWGVARVVRADGTEDDAASRLPVVLDASTGLTRQGDLVGSVGYMAPEQMDGDPDAVDARADVFALGVVLYELLALARFRQQKSVLEAVRTALEGEPARPSRVRSDVPPELDELCARATARDRDARIASAGELAEAIERFLDGDRDRALRHALSAGHVQSARKRLDAARDLARTVPERPAPGLQEPAQVEATREVVRALALHPENAEAQKLLVELMVDVSGPVPPEAEAEVQAHVTRMRTRGARSATWGLASMLLTFPIAVWLGVRSWLMVGMLTVVTGAAALVAVYASRHGARSWQTYVLASLCALLVTATSFIAGPFVLVPALAAVIAMYFVVHVSPEERRISLALITAGALLPYALELFGWVPPGFSFQSGGIAIHARMVEFPPTATVTGLLYTSVGFVALPAVLAGWMHDELMDVQRQTVLRAWHLKRLLTRLGEGQG
jgi:serine/threonine-protein kinase